MYGTQGGNSVWDTPGWYSTPGHGLDCRLLLMISSWICIRCKLKFCHNQTDYSILVATNLSNLPQCVFSSIGKGLPQGYIYATAIYLKKTFFFQKTQPSNGHVVTIDGSSSPASSSRQAATPKATAKTEKAEPTPPKKEKVYICHVT